MADPTPELIERWLSRLGRTSDVDLAVDGPDVVPELLDAYTPRDFRLRVLDGSWLRVAEGQVEAHLLGELHAFDDEISETGAIERHIATAVSSAEHLVFRLPAGAHGQRRGRRALRGSVDLYQQLGIESVRLTAVDAGRYVWAAAGFSFRTEDDRREVVRGVEEVAEAIGLPLLDLDPETCEPWEIAYMPAIEHVTWGEVVELLEAGLGADPAAADIWHKPVDRPGKLLLLADETPSWGGMLDLRLYDGNDGLEQLYAYTDDHGHDDE